MEADLEVAGRIERRLDALGLQPERVDAKVGLPSGTTERLRRGEGFLPGGRFLRGLCARHGRGISARARAWRPDPGRTAARAARGAGPALAGRGGAAEALP